MKVISRNDKISVFLMGENVLDKDNIMGQIKELIIKLKRKYNKTISGFYRVNIYETKICTIIDLIQEEEIDFLKDIIDLKIVICENEDIYLGFEDYYLFKNRKKYFLNNKYYVNLKEISKKEYLKVCEFCNIVYGEELSKIKQNKKLITI